MSFIVSVWLVAAVVLVTVVSLVVAVVWYVRRRRRLERDAEDVSRWYHQRPHHPRQPRAGTDPEDARTAGSLPAEVSRDRPPKPGPTLGSLDAELAQLGERLTSTIRRLESVERRVGGIGGQVDRLVDKDRQTAEPSWRGGSNTLGLGEGRRDEMPAAAAADADTYPEPDALPRAMSWVMEPVTLGEARRTLAGLTVSAARCDGEHSVAQWGLREMGSDSVPEAFLVQGVSRGDAWLVPNHPAYAPLSRLTQVRSGTAQLNRLVRTVVRFPRGKLAGGRFELAEHGLVDLDK